jgi:hypothetical protein
MRQAVTENKSSTNISRIISFQACEGLDKRIDQSMRANFKPPDPEYGPSQAAATDNNDGDLDLYS